VKLVPSHTGWKVSCIFFFEKPNVCSVSEFVAVTGVIAYLAPTVPRNYTAERQSILSCLAGQQSCNMFSAKLVSPKQNELAAATGTRFTKCKTRAVELK